MELAVAGAHGRVFRDGTYSTTGMCGGGWYPVGLARNTVLAVTVAAILLQALPWVPRDLVDYSRLPLLNRLAQKQQTFGTDTIADGYEARVVLNDPRDMYTKRKTAQTPIEARYWSPAASAPYPPAALLAEAGLFALGGRTTTGFYLLILACAAAFLALSLLYFLRTRWYLFPLLYLNFAYLGERFAGVQDCTYLLLLLLAVVALHLARARRPLAHVLMAIAIAIKLSPLFYVIELPRMPRRTAVLFVVIVAAGLVLPVVLWDNYLYIYTYGAGLKGHPSTRVAAVLLGVPFAALVWYVERRAGFDMEDRIGWGLVPMSLFLAVWTNSARHLLLVLLVPDKRGWRNVSVAAGLAAHTLWPSRIPLGSSMSIAIALLVLILCGYLWRIVTETRTCATPAA